MFCFTFLIIFRFLIDFLRIYPCYSYEPRKLLKNFTFTRQKLFLFHFCCNFLIKIHILLQHKDFHVILMEIFSFFTVFTLRNKYFSSFCFMFLINYHFSFLSFVDFTMLFLWPTFISKKKINFAR